MGQTGAYIAAKEFVTDRLRAPSTAQFLSQMDDQTSVTTITTCKFRVVGAVDAENGFGAHIRSRFVVVTHLDPVRDQWIADSVDLQ